MTTHYSPLSCSCIFCKKELKTSELPRHHYFVHDVSSFPKRPLKMKHSICKECGKEISHRGGLLTFCNRSCSAKYNNRLKTKESRLQQSKTLRKTLDSMPYTKIKFKVCQYCSNEFIWNSFHRGSKSFCSDVCFKNSRYERISKSCKDRGFGGVRPSCRIKYKGITLGSTYELKTVEILEQLSIEWNQPTRFKYVDPFGKSRTYTPDIYLPKFDVYLDPKNDFLINNVNPALGFKDSEKIRLASIQNNITIHILPIENITTEFISHLLGIDPVGFEPTIITIL